jgi:hypothetical protein
MTVAPEQKWVVAARAIYRRFCPLVRLASHLRFPVAAALCADGGKAASMEHMNGSQIELTPPPRHTEARPTGARRSRIMLCIQVREVRES